jgi:hypothetical protein
MGIALFIIGCLCMVGAVLAGLIKDHESLTPEE